MPTPVRGKPPSKQCLSHWIVEAISIASKSKGLALPALYERHGDAWALFRGVSVEDICAATTRLFDFTNWIQKVGNEVQPL